MQKRKIGAVQRFMRNVNSNLQDSKVNLSIKCEKVSEEEKETIINVVRKMQRKRRHDNASRLRYKMEFKNFDGETRVICSR